MENVPGRQLPLSLKSLRLHGTALFWTLVSGPKALVEWEIPLKGMELG